MKKIIPTEEEEQEVLAEYLALIGVPWFHVPNGGSRNVVEAKKLKRLGVKPGIPDIVIIEKPPNKPEAAGIVIELKRQKGGRVSDYQKYWLDVFKSRGWIAEVCHGAQEAIDLLEKLGFGGKAHDRKSNLQW